MIAALEPGNPEEQGAASERTGSLSMLLCIGWFSNRLDDALETELSKGGYVRWTDTRTDLNNPFRFCI
jgi:hypothetical protein